MKKILIIEDETMMRESLEEVFNEEGFEIELASDGQQGYEKIKENIFDLVLLDIILPRMNGYKVLEKLKAEKFETPPIILLTNLGEAKDIQKALDLGATSYLVKADYQLNDIIKKAKEVIEKTKKK